jgi:hypothetical protein
MEYGSKDRMRMENIRQKASGDWFDALVLAKRMAELIEQPGKAQARGYAAQEVFGSLSPVAYTFFERAYELGGSDVQAEASLNPIGDIDEAYEGISEDKLPASRREDKLYLVGTNKQFKPTPIESMGRVNMVNGSGPQFDSQIYSYGILEVWKDKGAKKPKLIWTANNEPNHGLGEEHNFLYDGKRSKWEMIDYIDTVDMANLVPLYGKNLMIYSYS